MKGTFITFEGSEGCGKSTHSALLFNYLKNKGFRVTYIREPGGTLVSEKIRRILLDPKNKSMSAECETLLYMSARAQIVREIISPALSKGMIVISDRFLDSTVVYQGYGLGVDIQTIKNIGRFATSGIKPDLTLFLDLPTREGLRKCGRIKDRIELRSLNYHQRVRCGYLELARLHPKRIKVVEVHHSKAITQDKIRKLVLELIA
ncbi:MAG: dTMP kinase [Candidatus Omnitrophota bacterium]|nr:MAG: dTMP kinase [Candidatus Omnitrophota bacterium]